MWISLTLGLVVQIASLGIFEVTASPTPVFNSSHTFMFCRAVLLMYMPLVPFSKVTCGFNTADRCDEKHIM